MKPDLSAQIRKRLTQECLTVLIADSGLGGLSVCAAIAAELKERPLTPQVSLIYYNAWPDKNFGYNRLADDDARIGIFEQALAGMARFAPDLILLACNTLSVLYPRTQFSRSTGIPVVDIIAFGTDMIRDALASDSLSRALILGTRTTIAARTHVEGLAAQGIDPRRLHAQPCHLLATEIEKGPASSSVAALVNQFMGKAVRRIGPWPGDLFAALCCTHFGYIGELIEAHLTELLPGRAITLLNPNESMARFLFGLDRGRGRGASRVAVRVVSKIPWETGRLAAIGSLLSPLSPETVTALQAYEQIPDLFTF
ncbi:MAG: aspartate/glutamate racemase family protein [Desulfobacterales bacterium]